MNSSQMSVENVKEIILKFPDEDKMMLLRELEKDMFPTVEIKYLTSYPYKKKESRNDRYDYSLVGGL